MFSFLSWIIMSLVCSIIIPVGKELRFFFFVFDLFDIKQRGYRHLR